MDTVGKVTNDCVESSDLITCPGFPNGPWFYCLKDPDTQGCRGEFWKPGKGYFADKRILASSASIITAPGSTFTLDGTTLTASASIITAPGSTFTLDGTTLTASASVVTDFSKQNATIGGSVEAQTTHFSASASASGSSQQDQIHGSCQPSNGTRIGIGAGVGLPLGLATVGALALGIRERRWRKRIQAGSNDQGGIDRKGDIGGIGGIDETQ